MVLVVDSTQSAKKQSSSSILGGIWGGGPSSDADIKPEWGVSRSPEPICPPPPPPPPPPSLPSAPLQLRMPMTVAQALKECNIHPRAFALVYVDDNGDIKFELSPSIAPKLAEIFPPDFSQHFLHVVKQRQDDVELQSAMRDRTKKGKGRRRSDPVVTGPPHQKRESISRTLEFSGVKRRKSTIPAPRTDVVITTPPLESTDDEEQDDPPDNFNEFEGAANVQTPIEIRDEAKLKKFYDTRFRQLQQLPCKTLAKAWIKIIQPKKQASNPYNGGRKARSLGCGPKGNGEVTRPAWWPPKEAGWCPHTEPDHIKKDQRLILLTHMLRGLRGTEWYRDVAALRQGTKDLFRDGEKDKECREWLEEIYAIRECEERYFRDEIDGSYEVSVNIPNQEPRPAPKKARSQNSRRQSSASSQRSSISIAHRRNSIACSPVTPMDYQVSKAETMFDQKLEFSDSGNGQIVPRRVPYQPREQVIHEHTSTLSMDPDSMNQSSTPDSVSSQQNFMNAQSVPNSAQMTFMTMQPTNAYMSQASSPTLYPNPPTRGYQQNHSDVNGSPWASVPYGQTCQRNNAFELGQAPGIPQGTMHPNVQLVSPTNAGNPLVQLSHQNASLVNQVTSQDFSQSMNPAYSMMALGHGLYGKSFPLPDLNVQSLQITDEQQQYLPRQ